MMVLHFQLFSAQQAQFRCALKHDVFGEIRTMTDEKGEVFFVGKDVATTLGYSNTRDALNKHVDVEDKLASQIATSGQRRNIIFINESGLYSLILSSKLPQAVMSFTVRRCRKMHRSSQKHKCKMTSKTLPVFCVSFRWFVTIPIGAMKCAKSPKSACRQGKSCK